MRVLICTTEDQLPDFLHNHEHEVAVQALEDSGCVVVARRSDGQVQVVPEDHVDAEVMRALLMWAAADGA